MLTFMALKVEAVALQRGYRQSLLQGSYNLGKTWKKGLFGKISAKTWKT